MFQQVACIHLVHIKLDVNLCWTYETEAYTSPNLFYQSMDVFVLQIGKINISSVTCTMKP